MSFVFRLALPVVALAVCVTAPAVADDLLDKARQLQEIAAQKTEAEVKESIQDALQLSRSTPAKSLQMLRGIQKRLEDDVDLTEDRRQTLQATVKRHITAIAGNAQDRAIKDEDAARRDAAARDRRAAEEAKRLEWDKLKKGLDEVNDLQKAGKNTEAARKADDLAKQFGDNPYIAASRKFSSVKDNISESARLRDRQAVMLVAAFREIDKAGIPIAGDMAFPDDYAERMKRRSPAQKLTKEEQSILTTLQKPVTVTFKAEPLQNFLDFMEKQFGFALVIDNRTLTAVGATTETTITANARGWTNRTVLKKVLGDLGLTYVIKQGTIQVVTPEEAKATLTTRSYYIGDLVGPINFRLPLVFNQMQAVQTVNNVIGTIQAQVDPGGWAPNGPGTIVFEPVTMSLLIRQTAEVHYMLGGGR